MPEKPFSPPWTQDQLDTLRRLAGDGVTPDEIALAVNRSLKAVYAKLRRYNIPFTHRPAGYASPKNPPPNADYTHLGGPVVKADYGYLPRHLHPDWSNVRFK